MVKTLYYFSLITSRIENIFIINLLRVEIKGRSRRSQVKIEQVYSEVIGQETAVSSN